MQLCSFPQSHQMLADEEQIIKSLPSYASLDDQDRQHAHQPSLQQPASLRCPSTKSFSPSPKQGYHRCSFNGAGTGVESLHILHHRHHQHHHPQHSVNRTAPGIMQCQRKRSGTASLPCIIPGACYSSTLSAFRQSSSP